MKSCTKCGKLKPASDFHKERSKADGLRSDCKECSRARRRKYYRDNREVERERYAAWRSRNPEWMRQWAERNADRIKANASEYYRENKARYRENTRKWREANPEAARKIARESYHRRTQCPHYRLDHSISACVYRSLRQAKGDRPTFELLGYALDELIAHLERQFAKGMTWQNYGEWHVDHILPLSSFSYETPEEPDFRRAWALTNLRPMWGTDNLQKGAKRLTLL